jgi:hypothetical protein
MLSSILGCAQLISIASAKLLDNNPFECGTSALRSLRTCLRRHPRFAATILPMEAEWRSYRKEANLY